MSVTATIKQSSSIGGVSFSESVSITGDGQIVHDVIVPVAQDASLTTRTSDTVGTLTMDESAHTVTTGARLDLYWAGGSRRGVTAGTVSGASVPFSGGSGDNLPSALTDIYVALPVELDVSVDGDNVAAALAGISKEGQVVFIDIDASEEEIAAWHIGAGGVKMWHENNADTNPFASHNIGRVYISHKDTSAAATGRIGIVYDNVAG